MYNKCVTDKAAAQQRKFEAAFLEMMKDKLFEDISISELCRYAGLSRKTFTVSTKPRRIWFMP